VASVHTTVWSRRRGSVGALRPGPNRDSEIAAAKEQRQGQQHDRDRDHRGDVVPAKDDRIDREMQVEGCGNRPAGHGEPAGEQQRGRREQLRDPDRGDTEDEARGPGEPAHEQELDEDADDQRDGQPGGDGVNADIVSWKR